MPDSFPHAPADWSTSIAEAVAREDGLELTDDHWQLVRALQEYYARHDGSVDHARELQDALDEKFHAKGGLKYLYQLFPEGPLSQGCRVAGVPLPHDSKNASFGSVS